MKLSMHVLAVSVLCAVVRPAAAQDKPADPSDKPPAISEKTSGMQKLDGLMPLYWQASSGKLFIRSALIDGASWWA